MIAYYLSGLKPTDVDSLEKLKELGLEYAFEAMPTVAEVLRGPDDNKGVSLSASSRHAKVGNQEWQEHETAENCWIGIPKDIDPESLRRESWEEIPSYEYRGWTVPVARAWLTKSEAVSCLPKRLKFNDGEFHPGPVVERYRRLEEIGGIVVEAILTNELPDNYFEIACEVLAMVYRIGPQEFAAIGPVEYSAQSAFNFLSNVADLPVWHALEADLKKTKSDSISQG